eukprot:1866898-Amphidinium_carterae.1
MVNLANHLLCRMALHVGILRSVHSDALRCRTHGQSCSPLVAASDPWRKLCKTSSRMNISHRFMHVPVLRQSHAGLAC